MKIFSGGVIKILCSGFSHNLCYGWRMYYFYQPDWVGLRAKTGVAVKCSVGILILEQHFEQTVCLHIWHFCPREREKRPKRVDIHTKHIRPRSTSCDLRKLKLTSHPTNQSFIKISWDEIRTKVRKPKASYVVETSPKAKIFSFGGGGWEKVQRVIIPRLNKGSHFTKQGKLKNEARGHS